MNIQALFAALQPFQNANAGTLVIPAASIPDWTGVNDLITKALANQTLVLANIAEFPASPTTNSILYRGTATLFPWNNVGTNQTVLTVTATFTVDAQGNPQLLLRGDLPVPLSGWTLAHSLDGLADTDLGTVEFEQGLFLLTSASTTVSDFQGTVVPYVNFQGVVATTGPFEIGRALLPSMASRTVAGQIDLTQGIMPVISLLPAGGAPAVLAGITMEFGVALSSSYEELPYNDPIEPLKTTIKVAFSQASLIATIAFGTGPALVLSLAVLPQSDLYTLSAGEAMKPLGSWADLEPLSSGINLGDFIPGQVPLASAMTLLQLDIALAFPDAASLPSVSSITFNVLMDVGNWALLPNDILTVQNVGALMTLSFEDGLAPAVLGSLYTNFTIVDEAAMIASIGVPDLLFTAKLHPDLTVSVADLMASVMDKLTGKSYRPPIEMEIGRLEMSVGLRDLSFGFGTDIVTDWSIAFGEANGGALITLSFQGITFDIEYDGQLLQGALTAYAGINEARLFFTAESPGDDVGWGFEGGLVDGSTLSVTNLLLNFMYPGGTIPGGSYGVPDLVIDKLVATLATDIGNTPTEFTFDGGMSLSWNFTVFPGSPEFVLSASLTLHGLRSIAPLAPRRLGYARRSVIAAQPPSGLADEDAPWQISGLVEGTFSLYNLLISAGYQFAPDNDALIFGIWYKERGLQATVTQRTNVKTSAKESILTVRFGDLSFGEILEYLVNLALPGETRRLSAPWDILYQINFKKLSLEVNLTTNDIAVKYAIDLDLTFAQFNAIALTYKNVNGEGRVYVELTGEFLGQPFGGENGEPLSWDVINDPAPEVPGKGPTLLDLRYVGMGQHIALSVPVSQLKTVEAVMTALRAGLRPVSGGGNPLSDPAAASLRYDGNANWMFGVDATILDTLSLQVVLFDPVLYGGVIALGGPRAGALAGLRFELLYRKVTDDIGELSVDLRVPDMFRHLEFGAVGVTLGLIHVDIYTNGNFRVDLGFPHNQDFSVSFAVEVFPFIGEGGFYFAYLTGATSERVPLIVNGEFSPVIEAGLGLSVGLGKDFQAGPLKAGLKVEVFGIFEGVFAPFNPYDRSIGPDNYYWIQGTAGIVGTLYGSVDFVVIRAEVSIVARASATFVLEAHMPSLVSMKLEVRAKAKIKILFVTMSFSFGLTIEQSFVIGSASATPWIGGGSSPRRVPSLLHARHLAAVGRIRDAVPHLRQQRSQRPIRSLTRLRHARHHFDALTGNAAYRSRHWAGQAALRLTQPAMLVRAQESPPSWAPVPVFGPGAAKTARVQFLPMFTIADPAGLSETSTETGANQIQIVLGFVAENTIAPDAHGHAALRRVTVDHVHHLDANGDAPLSAMVEAFFRWAAQEGAGKTGTQDLSLLALEDLLLELNDTAFQQASFGYGNLTDFLTASLHFEVAAYPSGGGTSTSGTLLPVFPDITAQYVNGDIDLTRIFINHNPVSAAYSANLSAYFQQLLGDATAGVASRPLIGEVTLAAPPAAPSTASLAELIFSQYFVLLTQAALQAAVALLQNYPYAYPDTDGANLEEIAGGFASLSVPVSLARGQQLADLALVTGHHPAALTMRAAATAGEPPVVDLPVGVTPLSIAEDNATVALATGLSIAMPALPYQVRAGQSLTNIAEAVPFVLNKIEPGAVGAALAALGGVLQSGATLQIPSFTYTPVAGDTQNFITAFFTVRNAGTTESVNLDWYEQAISTLNPNVDWQTINTGSPAITLPKAYLDSTPAATSYAIHQGDTLARIAATTELFQAMDNTTNPPVTAPVTIPAMAHIVTSTDRFDSLVVDFPGLVQADLIGANLTNAILSPLAVIPLPPFTAILPAGETLTTLAAAYDLSLPDLVDIVQEIGGLFAGPVALTIRDVPARSVDQFVAELGSTGQLNGIATQLSNFLAHGLRIPATDDTDFTNLTPQQVLAGAFTGKLYGMADQIGQQFPWPDTGVAATLTLTHASDGWLSFVSAMTVGEQPPTITERIRALNPRLGDGTAPRPGLILAEDQIPSINLTIDTASFGQYLPSTTVTLNADAPVALTNFDETAVQYSFQVTQHWQAASRPTLPGQASIQSPGEPSLWPLPANLRSAADAGGDASFALEWIALTAPPGTTGTGVSAYAWGIQIPVAISRVADPNDPGDTASAGSGSVLGSEWLEGLYLVRGAAASDSQRLYDLWTYLAESDSATLYLLYAPNGAGTTPQGYASDAVDRSKTVVLKTNLSTTTREQPDAVRATQQDAPPSATTFSATLEESTNFLSLLWQASVVVEGGFYLRYDAGGHALPDWVFDDTGRGTLQVLCLLTSQTDMSEPGGTLLALNNVAVVGANVDASAVQLYAVQTGQHAPQTRTATMPPGSVGFSITRTDPAPVSGDPTPAQLAGMLYNLAGYQIMASGGYLASNEAVPQGPAPSSGDTDGTGTTIVYSQVISVAPRAAPAGRIAQNNPWLPSPQQDPYAGISSSSEVGLSFAIHDVFGNVAVVTDPLASTTVCNRYTDRLIGIGDWPATSWSYLPSGSAATAAIVVNGGLQANTYLPDPQVSSEQALRSASAHAIKFQEAFYQASRPGITIEIATSLSATVLKSALAPLIGYLSASYVFTSQIAGMKIKTHAVTAGQTLAQVAASYSVAAVDLLRDNLDRPVNALFDPTVTIPVFNQAKHGETLNDFATRVGVPAATLLTQWQNAAVTMVPAGTDVIIAATTGSLVPGATLAQYATKSQCTVGDIGRANAATPGLITPELTLAVRGVVVTSGENSTLTSLVNDFSAAGIATDVEEIAAANQNLADLFDAAGSLTSYAVDRRLLATATSIADLCTSVFGGDLSSFISLNGDLPGLMTQDSRLQTGSSVVAAPVDGLRSYLAQNAGVSIVDFAGANAASTMTTSSVVQLPALLDPAGLAATPYGIQPNVNFGQIATLFGTSAETLGTQVQNIPGIFVPGQTVTVTGAGSAVTDREDSLASLLAKFPAGTVALPQLIATIAPQNGLMLAGAPLICPAPQAQLAGPGTLLSLQTIASSFLDSAGALALAKANAALAGFLKAGAGFTVAGQNFTVGPWQTLANLFGAVTAVLTTPLAYDAFLIAVGNAQIVDPNSMVLLPPPPVALSAGLPASPAIGTTIGSLSASVTLRRPTGEIDEHFADVAAVASATTTVAAQSSGVPASLAEFATATADLYGGALWTGISAADEQGYQRQYTVRFAAPGTTSIKSIRQLGFGNASSFLALPPLANCLVSRTAPVRDYLSGANPPFSATSKTLVFQAVDVGDWVIDFLATVDLLLSPSYASAAYAATVNGGGDSAAFDLIMNAKASLADKISAQLMPIQSGGSVVDLVAAKKAMRQSLSVNLSIGYGTAAVIQTPVTVEASFAGTGLDAGGHRLTGKAASAPVPLSAAVSLQDLATVFIVSVEGVTELLAETPNVLQTGVTLTLGPASWTIGENDTIADGIVVLGTTPAIFATTFADQKPLFRDGALLTIDGYAATVGFGATLMTMANTLDVSVLLMGIANQDLSGLLTGTVYIGGEAVVITPAISSLAELAKAQNLRVAALVPMIANQAVLTRGAVLHVLQWVPEYSLVTGKIDLDKPSGALTSLLTVKNRARFRRLFLNLNFAITALEFAVEPAGHVDGYETSKWLHFVNPLPDAPAKLGGAEIATRIGQLEIPVPLRAYPPTPRLVNQRAVATYSPADIDPDAPLATRIRMAEAWSYYASFEMALAAQDTATITIGLNFHLPSKQRALASGTDPFANLAEYASNAAAIKADLATLVQPQPSAGAVSAVRAMAELATDIAANWGFVQPGDTVSGGRADGLVPALSFGFELQTRARMTAAGESLLDALVLIRTEETVSWGPDGQIPMLGYLDEQGTLIPLQAPPPPVGTPPQALQYGFAEDVSVDNKRTYVIWYTDLNVVTYQNARGSVAITRNQNLTPGRATDSRFVYQTPPLTFTNLATPNLRWDLPTLFGSAGIGDLAAALTALFTDVLGNPPTAAQTTQSLLCGYGFRLAAEGSADSPMAPGDLVSVIPVFYRPVFAYAASVPGDTMAAVTDWFGSHVPDPANTAFITFELQIFSTMIVDLTQPLIKFARLDFALVQDSVGAK